MVCIILCTENFFCKQDKRSNAVSTPTDPMASSLVSSENPIKIPERTRYFFSCLSLQIRSARKAVLSKKVRIKSMYAVVDSHANTKLDAIKQTVRSAHVLET